MHAVSIVLPLLCRIRLELPLKVYKHNPLPMPNDILLAGAAAPVNSTKCGSPPPEAATTLRSAIRGLYGLLEVERRGGVRVAWTNAVREHHPLSDPSIEPAERTNLLQKQRAVRRTDGAP